MIYKISRSFKHFKDALLYGKKSTITLEEFQSPIRTKELTKLQDLTFEDSGEGLIDRFKRKKWE